MRTFLFLLLWLIASALFLYFFGPTPAPLATIIQNFKSGWLGLAASFSFLIVAVVALYFWKEKEEKRKRKQNKVSEKGTYGTNSPKE